MSVSKVLFGGKLGPPPPTPGNYIAVGVSSNPSVTLLDHTTAGSVSYSASVSLSGNGISPTFGWSNSGNYLAAGTGSTNGILTLFDHTTLGSLTIAASYTGETGTFSYGVAFTSDDNYIAYNSDTTVTLLDHSTPGTLSLAATYTTGIRYNLDISPDNNYIVSVGDTNNLTLLDHTTPGSLSLATTYTTSGSARSVKFSPSGDYVAVGSTGTPYFAILDHTTPGTLTFSASSSTGASCAALSWAPNEDYIATGGNVVRLYSHSAGSVSLITTYAAVTSANGVSFSPVGNYIAATRNSTTFTLLDRTSPTALTLAATYTLRATGRSCEFSKT